MDSNLKVNGRDDASDTIEAVIQNTDGFLRELLRDGPLSEAYVLERAEKAEISSERIRSAVERLGITYKKRPAGVVMVLPRHEQNTETML